VYESPEEFEQKYKILVLGKCRKRMEKLQNPLSLLLLLGQSSRNIIVGQRSLIRKVIIVHFSNEIQNISSEQSLGPVQRVIFLEQENLSSSLQG
jgi:uncharacterized protein (DUF924 family)